MEGTVAIYGNEALYNDYVVMTIPSLRKDPRGNGRQQDGLRKRAKEGFGAVLESEKKNRESSINVTTIGYTRDARMIRTIYQMHEYPNTVG